MLSISEGKARNIKRKGEVIGIMGRGGSSVLNERITSPTLKSYPKLRDREI